MIPVTISRWHLARDKTVCSCGCQTKLKVGDKTYRIRQGRYFLAEHFFAEPNKESSWDVDTKKAVPVAEGSVHK